MYAFPHIVFILYWLNLLLNPFIILLWKTFFSIEFLIFFVVIRKTIDICILILCLVTSLNYLWFQMVFKAKNVGIILKSCFYLIPHTNLYQIYLQSIYKHVIIFYLLNITNFYLPSHILSHPIPHVIISKPFQSLCLPYCCVFSREPIIN